MASYTVYENNLRGSYEKAGTYDNWYAVVDDYLSHSVVLEDAYKEVIIDEGYEQYPGNKIFNISEAEYYFDKFCEIVLRELGETGRFEMLDFYIEVEDDCHRIALRADHVEVDGPDKLRIICPYEVSLSPAYSMQKPRYALGHEELSNLANFNFYGEVYLTESQLKEYTENNFTNEDIFKDIFNKSGYAFSVKFEGDED